MEKQQLTEIVELVIPLLDSFKGTPITNGEVFAAVEKSLREKYPDLTIQQALYAGATIATHKIANLQK